MIRNPKAASRSCGAQIAPSGFPSDRLKAAGNTPCIFRAFGAIWWKLCKQDACRSREVQPSNKKQKEKSLNSGNSGMYQTVHGSAACEAGFSPKGPCRVRRRRRAFSFCFLFGFQILTAPGLRGCGKPHRSGCSTSRRDRSRSGHRACPGPGRRCAAGWLRCARS